MGTSNKVLTDILKVFQDILKIDYNELTSFLDSKGLLPNGGTGGGGSNTNKNGLCYEKLTELNTEYSVLDSSKHFKKIKFEEDESIEFIKTDRTHLFKYLDEYVDKKIKKAHGCKVPDECYINENTKTIFIIEKKFQNCGGSVCEKIQTSDFKIWQYCRTFPNHKIVYIYCLSEWFRLNCVAELEYLEEKKNMVFWGNNENYKKELVNFIVNYK